MAYPTTAIELKRAMEDGLSVFDGHPASVSWTGERYREWVPNGPVPLVPVTVDSNGEVMCDMRSPEVIRAIEERQTITTKQIYFSERDVCVAFWHNFVKWRELAGIGCGAEKKWALHWRIPLEIEEKDGVWFIYARFLITCHPDACKPPASVAA